MEEWKKELENILSGVQRSTRAEKENAMFERFLKNVAAPALQQIADELVRLGRDAVLREAPASTILSVKRDAGIEEISFRIVRHFVNSGILPRAEVRIFRNQRIVRYEGMFRPEGAEYTMADITQRDIIEAFLYYYRMVTNVAQ